MTDLKSLLGVVVLYKCNIEESNTIISLNKSLERIRKDLMLLVYDNGPDKQNTEKNFKYGHLNIIYKHDPDNPGISTAYNEGINIAGRHGADWILLLDQDTIYTAAFIESYLGLSMKNLKSETVCIIPRVLSIDSKKQYSPSKIYAGGIIRPASKIKPGIINKPITGINSGTFISIPFIKSVGGFSNEYPLDMLDHWYFREIARGKKKVLLLNSVIHHHLSVNSFFDDVSVSRYNSILLSERRFFSDRILDLCVYKLRLVIRLIKQFLAGKKEYAKLTLNFMIK